MNRRDIFKKLFTSSSGTGVAPGTGWQQPVALQVKHFTASVELRFLNTRSFGDEPQAGFRLFENEQDNETGDAAVDLLKAGVTKNGYLFIGNTTSDKRIAEEILMSVTKLVLTVIPQHSGRQYIKLKAMDGYGNTLTTLSLEQEIKESLDATVYTNQTASVYFINQSIINPNRQQ